MNFWTYFPYVAAVGSGQFAGAAQYEAMYYPGVNLSALYGQAAEVSNTLLDSFLERQAFPMGTLVADAVNRNVYFLPPYAVTLAGADPLVVSPSGPMPTYLMVNVDTLVQTVTSYNYGQTIPVTPVVVDANHLQAQGDARWRYYPAMGGLFCWEVPGDIWESGGTVLAGYRVAGAQYTYSDFYTNGQQVTVSIPNPWVWVNPLIAGQTGSLQPGGFTLGPEGATVVYSPAQQPKTLFDAVWGQVPNPIGLVVLDTAFLGDTFVCLYVQAANSGWFYGLDIWQMSELVPGVPPLPPPTPLAVKFRMRDGGGSVWLAA